MFSIILSDITRIEASRYISDKLNYNKCIQYLKNINYMTSDKKNEYSVAKLFAIKEYTKSYIRNSFDTLLSIIIDFDGDKILKGEPLSPETMLLLINQCILIFNPFSNIITDNIELAEDTQTIHYTSEVDTFKHYKDLGITLNPDEVTKYIKEGKNINVKANRQDAISSFTQTISNIIKSINNNDIDRIFIELYDLIDYYEYIKLIGPNIVKIIENNATLIGYTYNTILTLIYPAHFLTLFTSPGVDPTFIDPKSISKTGIKQALNILFDSLGCTTSLQSLSIFIKYILSEDFKTYIFDTLPKQIFQAGIKTIIFGKSLDEAYQLARYSRAFLLLSTDKNLRELAKDNSKDVLNNIINYIQQLLNEIKSYNFDNDYEKSIFKLSDIIFDMSMLYNYFISLSRLTQFKIEGPQNSTNEISLYKDINIYIYNKDYELYQDYNRYNNLIFDLQNDKIFNIIESLATDKNTLNNIINKLINDVILKDFNNILNSIKTRISTLGQSRKDSEDIKPIELDKLIEDRITKQHEKLLIKKTKIKIKELSNPNITQDQFIKLTKEIETIRKEINLSRDSKIKAYHKETADNVEIFKEKIDEPDNIEESKEQKVIKDVKKEVVKESIPKEQKVIKDDIKKIKNTPKILSKIKSKLKNNFKSFLKIFGVSILVGGICFAGYQIFLKDSTKSKLANMFDFIRLKMIDIINKLTGKSLITIDINDLFSNINNLSKELKDNIPNYIPETDKDIEIYNNANSDWISYGLTQYVFKSNSQGIYNPNQYSNEQNVPIEERKIIIKNDNYIDTFILPQFYSEYIFGFDIKRIGELFPIDIYDFKDKLPLIEDRKQWLRNSMKLKDNWISNIDSDKTYLLFRNTLKGEQVKYEYDDYSLGLQFDMKDEERANVLQVYRNMFDIHSNYDIHVCSELEDKLITSINFDNSSNIKYIYKYMRDIFINNNKIPISPFDIILNIFKDSDITDIILNASNVTSKDIKDNIKISNIKDLLVNLLLATLAQRKMVFRINNNSMSEQNIPMIKHPNELLRSLNIISNKYANSNINTYPVPNYNYKNHNNLKYGSHSYVNPYNDFIKAFYTFESINRDTNKDNDIYINNDYTYSNIDINDNNELVFNSQFIYNCILSTIPDMLNIYLKNSDIKVSEVEEYFKYYMQIFLRLLFIPTTDKPMGDFWWYATNKKLYQDISNYEIDRPNTGIIIDLSFIFNDNLEIEYDDKNNIYYVNINYKGGNL